jgi:hypothetical protein
METKASLFEPLLEKVEQYGKTNLELLKLRTLDKTADVTSTLISRSLLAIILSLFALTLNIGLAFWIGDLLRKNYYGFFVVASFYALIGIILCIIHPSIKSRIQNSIIKQMFN